MSALLIPGDLTRSMGRRGVKVTVADEGGKSLAGTSRLKVIPEFLRPAGRGARAEVFRPDDPAPAIRELSLYSRALLRDAVARLGRPASRA